MSEGRQAMSAALRKELRAERRNLSAAFQRHASRSVTRLLSTSPVFLRATRVAFYLAAEGELDPAPLMNRALRLNKQCFLPVLPRGLMPRTVSRLLFQRYDPEKDDLVVNRFGILEPAYQPRHLIRPSMLDLVLMPLVGFDREGNRLGMGKGFYDKTFAGIHGHWRRPRLLGMAYAFQEVDALLPRDWDVPVDGIATEKEVILVR